MGSATTPEEARKILDHLLEKLQDPESRHYARYGSWVEKHFDLEDFLLDRLRPEVLKCLKNGVKQVNDLKTIGGDLGFQGRAVYIHGIAGLDRFTRLYVGQTTYLASRIWRQHNNFRYRRDNHSLHYHAMQNSTYDHFAVLAVIPNTVPANAAGMDRPDLVLNVLEMWGCLLFRTLPPELLMEYLPPGLTVPVGPPDGLNVASPLDHGLETKFFERADLSGTKDPLLIEYFNLGERKLEVVAKKNKNQRNKANKEREPLPLQSRLILVGMVAMAAFIILRNPSTRVPGRFR